jgi:hypothetical protein
VILEKLLQLIAQGGVRSYDDLTKELSTSQPLLEVMLEDLARLGYLRSVDMRCGGHCQGCTTRGCSIAGPGRVWSLTTKGTQAAGRLDANRSSL